MLASKKLDLSFYLIISISWIIYLIWLFQSWRLQTLQCIMSLSELLWFQWAHQFQFRSIASNHTLFLILSMKWIAEIYNTWRHNWIQQKQMRWSCNHHLIIFCRLKFAQFFKFNHFDLSLRIISFIYRQMRERHWFCSSMILRMRTLWMIILFLSQ